MANPQVFNTLVASKKEATYGATPSSTIIYHWVTEPNFQPRALRHIADEGFRGVAGQMFDLIPGPGEGTVGFGAWSTWMPSRTSSRTSSARILIRHHIG